LDCDASACSENYKTEDVSLVTPFPPLQGRRLSILSMKQIHTSAPNDGTNQRCDSGKAFITLVSVNINTILNPKSEFPLAELELHQEHNSGSYS